MKMYEIVALIVALALVAACGKIGVVSPGGADGRKDVPVWLRSSLPRTGCVKAAMQDEDRIVDVNLWAYLDGKLDAECYCDGGSAGAILRLYEGREYQVYALANVGKVEAPATLEDLMLLRVPFDAAGGAIPMANRDGQSYSSLYGNSMALYLEKLYAKITLAVNSLDGDAHTLTLNDLKVCGVPEDIAAFADGPYDGRRTEFHPLDAEEMVLLGEGEEATFYLPEHCPCSDLDDTTSCTYAVVDAAIDYEERPNDHTVYSRRANMRYAFAIGDEEGNLRRNGEYLAGLRYYEGGFRADSRRADMSGLAEETAFVVFCDENGMPVSELTVDPGRDSFNLYYCVYLPADASHQIRVAPEADISGCHLSAVSEAFHDGGPYYHNTYNNDYASRVATDDVIFSIFDRERNIRASCLVHFKGSKSPICDLDGPNEDETVNF